MSNEADYNRDVLTFDDITDNPDVYEDEFEEQHGLDGSPFDDDEDET